MLRKINDEYKTITFVELSAMLSDVMPMFWESSTKTEDLSRQYMMWFEVLKDYSAETVSKVAMDWIKNAKRKPTPADFLDLCREVDHTPDKCKRLAYLSTLTETKEWRDDGKMNGDPVVLGKIMRFAAENKINYWEGQQMDYLRTGVIPDWYRPTIDKVIKQGLTREELLATMSPEAQLAAIKPSDNWKY